MRKNTRKKQVWGSKIKWPQVERILKSFTKSKFKTKSITIQSEFSSNIFQISHKKSKSSKLHNKIKASCSYNSILRFPPKDSNQISPVTGNSIPFKFEANFRMSGIPPPNNKQTYRTALLTCGQKINSVKSSFKVSNLLFWMLEYIMLLRHYQIL